MKHQESPLIRFLYGTAAGRICLKPFVSRSFSRFMGKLLSGRISRLLISGFIRRNHIDMSEYEKRDYVSFNDFFTRKVRADARPIDCDPYHLISPCDGNLLAYDITPDSCFTVKRIKYSLESLLCSREIAARFCGGTCLVFRLTPAHYHRYIFIDNIREFGTIYIDGIFHCVRPPALMNTPVFITNCREYALMATENFGSVVHMEVGAMSVGKISNHEIACPIRRGEEKGFFEFGGSTVIVLLAKGVARLRPDIAESSAYGLESPVQLGEQIGVKCIERSVSCESTQNSTDRR